MIGGLSEAVWNQRRKPEDLENPAKIKEILNRETGKLLIDQGYIRPDGTEIRIARPGVRVILDPDNTIKK